MSLTQNIGFNNFIGTYVANKGNRSRQTLPQFAGQDGSKKCLLLFKAIKLPWCPPRY